MKNLFTTISILLLLSLAGVSCTTDKDSDLSNGQYFTLSFASVRSYGGNTENSSMTSLGSDIDLDEGRVSELRVIVFRHGEDQSVFNHKYSSQEMPQNRVKFFVSKSGFYDLFFIANETATDQGDTELSFLKDKSVMREKLYQCDGLHIVNTVPNERWSGSKKGLFVMTAAYENILLDRVGEVDGRESSPFRLDLTQANTMQRPEFGSENRSAVELMRSQAKIEVILKGVVKADYSNGKDHPYYSWVMPYGFSEDSFWEVSLINMPMTYRLMPQAKFCNSSSLVAEPGYKYTTQGNRKPNPEQVVRPSSYTELEDPIGGIEVLDYSVCFYVSEFLGKKAESLENQQRPAIKVLYRRSGSGKAEEKIYPIENGKTTSSYEYIIQSMYGSADRPEYNIYRNKYYKMNLNITGKQFEWVTQ